MKIDRENSKKNKLTKDLYIIETSMKKIKLFNGLITITSSLVACAILNSFIDYVSAIIVKSDLNVGQAIVNFLVMSFGTVALERLLVKFNKNEEKYDELEDKKLDLLEEQLNNNQNCNILYYQKK